MEIDLSLGLSREQLKDRVANFVIPVEMAHNQEITIAELLQSLQGKKVGHKVNYFYAVDEKNVLCGVASTRSILYSDPQTKLKEIIDRNIIKIDREATLENALKLLSKHELLAVPVTDHQGHLCGIFQVLPQQTTIYDDNSRTNNPFSKEVFQLIGLSIEQGKLKSSLMEYRYRMPWLLCNVVSGLLCAAIASVYEALMMEVVVISMFIPLVLSLGESVAMQSMTLSLQFFRSDKIHWRKILRRVLKEWKASLLLGITCSLILAAVYLSWLTGYKPMFAITISVFLAILVATSFGSLLPITLRALSLDPKVASGPVVLMLTDVTVTALYLAFSSWLLLN